MANRIRGRRTTCGPYTARQCSWVWQRAPSPDDEDGDPDDDDEEEEEGLSVYLWQFREYFPSWDVPPDALIALQPSRKCAPPWVAEAALGELPAHLPPAGTHEEQEQ
eukprot:gene3716-4128_t